MVLTTEIPFLTCSLNLELGITWRTGSIHLRWWRPYWDGKIVAWMMIMTWFLDWSCMKCLVMENNKVNCSLVRPLMWTCFCCCVHIVRTMMMERVVIIPWEIPLTLNILVVNSFFNCPDIWSYHWDDSVYWCSLEGCGGIYWYCLLRWCQLKVCILTSFWPFDTCHQWRIVCIWIHIIWPFRQNKLLARWWHWTL